MFTLLQNNDLKKHLGLEAPALTVALLLIETFFKIHSFFMECLAFLVAWFVLSYLFSLARLQLTKKATR